MHVARRRTRNRAERGARRMARKLKNSSSYASQEIPMAHDLSVRFFGVRGSIASPGASMISGGNTACLEVRAGDTRVVLDAGTGLRALGDERMASGIRNTTILLSHLHWDHVAGLPFFTPVYVPGFRTDIVSGPNGALPLFKAIRELFRAPFFPVAFDDLRGEVTTRELRAADRFTIGELTVEMARLNHPDPVYGFRIEHGGRAIVYATDTEHFACVDPTLARLANGADVLVYDAQYTPAEYPSRVGWGHSTWQAGVELARTANVGQLVLFHHDPARTDAQLAAIEADARAALPGTTAAREGVELFAREAASAAA
jgi:phosphoribosyl 1,2-cyclic phosphodiesterase